MWFQYCTAAVSYTHLDVYKRQLHVRKRKWLDKSSNEIFSYDWDLSEFDGTRLNSESVSYTHLDVYKRQTLNMAQKGLFGEVLHVEGSYIHNLEEFWPYYWNNWRLDYNREFRGDVYATHGLAHYGIFNIVFYICKPCGKSASEV